MIFFPGGVTILGGQDPIVHMKEPNVDFSLTDFDFAVYDCQTGQLSVFNSSPGHRILQERYHFTPGRGGNLSFRITSDLIHLEVADAVIEEALKSFPVDGKEVGIALTELLDNAMRVAHDRSQTQEIEIGLLYVPGFGMFLSVTDQLGRLNLDALPDSFLDAAGDTSREVHGRGLLIIAALMQWIAENPCEQGEGYKEMLIKIPLLKGDNQHV